MKPNLTTAAVRVAMLCIVKPVMVLAIAASLVSCTTGVTQRSDAQGRYIMTPQQHAAASHAEACKALFSRPIQ